MNLYMYVECLNIQILIQSNVTEDAAISVNSLTSPVPPHFMIFFPQTYIGSILVSVNPYKLLNIYGTDMVLQYEGHGLRDNPP